MTKLPLDPSKGLFGTPAKPGPPLPRAKILNKKKPAVKRSKTQKVLIKQRRQKHAASIRPVHVDLQYRHDINGVPYGPGRVLVGRGVADVLLENERNIKRSEENFYGTKAVIIGPRGPRGHTSRRVAPEMFETGGYLNVAPLANLGLQGEQV